MSGPNSNGKKSALHKTALKYAGAGIPVFPCRPCTKVPATEHGFKDASCDPNQINRWWEENRDYNIGLVPEQAGWFVIDEEHTADPNWCNGHGQLPPTHTVATPRGGKHYYFGGSGPSTVQKLAPNVDSRGRNGYILVPPSIVFDEKTQKLGKYRTIEQAPIADLPDWVLGELEAPERKETSPTSGDPVTEAHLCELLGWYIDPDRPYGSWRDVVGAIHATPLDDDPDGSKRLDIAIRWSRGELDVLCRYDQSPPSRYTDDDAVKKCFRTMPPKKGGVAYGTIYHLARKAGYDGPPARPLMAERFKPILAKAESEAEPEDDTDREPMDLFGEASLGGEPKLTREMLPKAIADFAFDAADRLGVEPAMVAIPALAVAAACLHNGIQLQPKANDTSWTESARLWFAVVAPPGGRKSPALSAALKPLRAIEAEWAREDAIEEAKYERALADWKAACRGRTDNIKEMGAAAAEVTTRNKLPEMPLRPKKRRLEVGDATMEALALVLADNERGVLAIHDELVGMIAGFDAYRSGAGGKDRTSALVLWNGHPRTIDRVKVGATIRVPNWGASVFGGIQPRKLHELVSKNSLDGDGFLQRFQPFFGVTEGRGVDRVPNEAALRAYGKALERVLDLEPRMPAKAITLAGDAQQYRYEVEMMAEAFAYLPTTPDALKGHLDKWPALYARLLLTLHALEWSTTPREVDRLPRLPKEVPPATARKARDLMLRFFLPNAIRFYDEFFKEDDQEGSDARWIAGYILARELESVSARDLKRAYRELRDNDNRLMDAMDLLRRADWVGDPERPKKDSMVWAVNAEVHRRYRERGLAEKKRRDAEKAKIHEAAARASSLRSE